MYGQFHTDTKVFFARQSERTCLHTSSQRAHPLPQASEPQAGTTRWTFRTRFSSSIVDHCGTDCSVSLDQRDLAVSGSAVPNDVGYPLAHRPGKNGGRLRRKGEGVQFDLGVDPRRFQELARPLQFALKPGLPVAGHRLTYLTQRLACHTFNLRELLRTTLSVFRDQVPRQFALEGDHGERLPQQIMQVASQARSLLLDLEAGQFSPRGMQLPDGAAHAGDADHIQTESSHHQHQGNEPPPIYSHDPSM